jgi:hypothetical protein
MIPKRIVPYSRVIKEKKDQYGEMTDIELCCCGESRFGVELQGGNKVRLFNRFLMVEVGEERFIFCAVCDKCGKKIAVFDTACDGYDNQIPEKQQTETAGELTGSSEMYKCPKCKEGLFSIKVKYEYSDPEEMKELNLKDESNAFGWIYISLECCSCGKKIGDFLNFETE